MLSISISIIPIAKSNAQDFKTVLKYGEKLDLANIGRQMTNIGKKVTDIFVGGRYDYYWEMADGAVAVNRGVRGYRSVEYVFSSIFDQTAGDCDTEVWQNSQRYQNLCVGRAGGQGTAFVNRHGGIVAFYRK